MQIIGLSGLAIFLPSLECPRGIISLWNSYSVSKTRFRTLAHVPTLLWVILELLMSLGELCFLPFHRAPYGRSSYVANSEWHHRIAPQEKPRAGGVTTTSSKPHRSTNNRPPPSDVAIRLGSGGATRAAVHLGILHWHNGITCLC